MSLIANSTVLYTTVSVIVQYFKILHVVNVDGLEYSTWWAVVSYHSGKDSTQIHESFAILFIQMTSFRSKINHFEYLKFLVFLFFCWLVSHFRRFTCLLKDNFVKYIKLHKTLTFNKSKRNCKRKSHKIRVHTYTNDVRRV